MAALPRGLLLAVLLSALALAPAAWAGEPSQTPSVRLAWVRGENTEGCSDGSVVARRVSARLGKNVFSAEAPTSIEGVIQRDGKRWEAHLYIRGADGRLAGDRVFTSDGPDCEALDAAATLAVALAIDPEAALRAAPETPSDSPAQPSSAVKNEAPVARPALAPAVAPTAPRAPHAAHAPNDDRAAQGTLRGLVAAGLLPEPSLGVALSTEVEVARFMRISIGGLYLPEVRGGVDFAFGLTAGWVGACFHPLARARVDLSLCGKVLLGAIHSVVFVLEPVQPGDRLWSGAALSAQASLIALGPIAVEVGGEAVAPLVRDRFMVQGRSGVVFQQPPLGVMAFVGVGVAIP
jgi:hypothetical protein